jgi:molecular chaperone GrpE
MTEGQEQEPECIPELDIAPGAPETMQEQTELEKLEAEVRDYKEKYLRALADAENQRKRMVKERDEQNKFTIISVLADFLHPLDNFENALRFSDQMSPEVKNWAMGFQMILSQFKEALNAQGAQPMQTVGLAFDPHLHEAVEMQETTEHPPGIILEEFTRGYTLGNRIIRAARVKVSQAPKSAPQNDVADSGV